MAICFSKKSIFFLLLLLQFFGLSVSQTNFSHYMCLNPNVNYTKNSAYEEGLNNLVTLASDSVSMYGFYNASTGESPDQVNVLALCRGDVALDSCRICLNDSKYLLQLCPFQKEAIGWYENCMLRYSNRSIIGVADTSIVIAGWKLQNATDISQFNKDLGGLLDNLRSQAASGGSLKKFATGNVNSGNFVTIYGLVQCTPDLSEIDCNNCLQSATEDIPTYFNGKVGGEILYFSCTLQYETYKFFNDTLFVSPSSPPPSSPSLSPPPPFINTTTQGNKGDRSQTIIIIIVVAVSTLATVLIILISLYFWKKKPTVKVETHNEEVDTDIRVESLQYNFESIRIASNNFSDNNKLGQGGFGAVFRGLLPDGEEIAVKRLSANSAQGDQEFKNEVLLVAKLQHRNLARLLGFSMKGQERLLIYEFLSNGSLDHFLFGAVDISFVVLTDLNQDDAYVYSFGVLVLEIVCGQNSNSFQVEDTTQGLLDYAWRNWGENTALNLVDPKMEGARRNEIMRCIHIGLSCVQENLADRPTMASIVLALSSYSTTLPVPSHPARFMHSGGQFGNSLEPSNGCFKSESRPGRVNSVCDASISDLEPR
ncbi:Gnk2-homologous domain [Dillenia turbinata]|uniref:Gnk2-homologous domain n=1 Tax=Dillenia turbinata TaxID=194707 RepID=A0AAN8UID8_9MAGN